MLWALADSHAAPLGELASGARIYIVARHKRRAWMSRVVALWDFHREGSSRRLSIDNQT